MEGKTYAAVLAICPKRPGPADACGCACTGAGAAAGGAAGAGAALAGGYAAVVAGRVC
jgi:hypothetical protein